MDIPSGPSTQSPERQLWCAVLGRALEDALGNPGGIGEARARSQAVRDARLWFAENGDDFRRACDAAGFEPDLLRDRALRLMARHEPGLLAFEGSLMVQDRSVDMAELLVAAGE